MSDEPGTEARAGRDLRTTDGNERRRLKEEYKNRERVAGVFAVTNTASDRVFLGSCLEAERPLGRLLFELQLGSCRIRELQRDFSTLGEEAFRFEVVETVPTDVDDPAEELELLEQRHLAALDRSNTYNTDDRIRFR